MLLEPAVLLSSRPLNFAVPGLALGLMLVAAGCDRQTGDQAQPQGAVTAPAAATAALAGMIDRSHKGEPLPDLTLKDPAGRTLALDAVKGPVLINLWATWCAPCVIELPLLDKLAADRAGSLRVITVSQDMAGGTEVAEFLRDKGVTRLEPWLDPENDLAFRYGGGTLPTTIYYDASGHEVWRYVGDLDWTGPEAAAMLAEG
jgi:thiol-disulfide isomerase/thioredoxin